MELESVKNFLCEFSGDAGAEVAPLPASGSARRNYNAVAKNGEYILTFNQNIRENEAFFYFSAVFANLKLNTPKVLKISDDRKVYIQQKVGAQTLSEIIAAEGLSPRVKMLVNKSLAALFKLQKASEGKVDFTKTFEYERYDVLPVVHDLYYFKNYFADILETEYHRSALLKEFLMLAEIIENMQPKGLMLRDFQARNILVDNKDDVFFIDYQAAMEGPLLYDVVSLLYQAKANFPETAREEFLNYYLSFFENKETKKKLLQALPYLKLMRLLQVLGAYGLRGLIQKKTHFVASINQGVANLIWFCESWPEISVFPQLSAVVQQLKSAEIQQKIKI